MKDKKNPDVNSDELENIKNQLARALADYSNLQKRASEERQLYTELATINLLTKLFPLRDNLEKAYDANQDVGVGMVLKQLTDLLAAEGLKEIDNFETFDPSLHEAIATEESEVDGKILKVIEKGYKHNDRVLKAAKVVVGKAAETND